MKPEPILGRSQLARLIDKPILTGPGDVLLAPIAPAQMARLSAGALAASLAIQIMSVATGVLVARLIGPVGKGELTAVMLWPGFVAAVGSLGFLDAVTYYVAHRKGEERAITGTSMVVTLALAALLMVAWFVAAPFVLSGYGEGSIKASRLFVTWIPLYLIALTLMGVLLGTLQVATYNRIRLLIPIVSLLGLLLLVVIGRRSLTAVVIVYLVAHLVVLVYALVATARRHWLTLRPRVALIRPMLAYGLKSHLGTMSGIANERADQALISLLLPAYLLGLYSVSVSMTAAVVLVGNSFAMVALPAVTSASTESEMKARFGSFVRASILLSIAVALLLVALTPWVIESLFGRAFVPATAVTQVLLVASICLSANRAMSAGLKAFNRPMQAGLAELVALGVTVAALGLLLPRFGIMGAAVASFLAYATSFALMIRSARRLGIAPTMLLVPTSGDLGWALQALRGAWSRRSDR